MNLTNSSLPYKRNWFEAKFKSRCLKCDNDIHTGDKVSYSREDDGHVICESCARIEDDS